MLENSHLVLHATLPGERLFLKEDCTLEGGGGGGEEGGGVLHLWSLEVSYYLL